MWCQKDNKHKPDAMDIYKFLWRGRDIELTYIWEPLKTSVFRG